MIQALEYKKLYNEFKSLISKTSSLYYDFWSSLFSSHIQGTMDFLKLNEIGNKINKLKEKIDKTFIKLNKIKKNDFELLKLYESFIKNILNNEKKYNDYHNISINLKSYKIIKNKEIDYSNFDLGILNETDENSYLIISTEEERGGTILNMSLNACHILGYYKNELIGKNINILIPEIFKKMHDKEFNSLTEQFKTDFYEDLVNKKIYKPGYTEQYVHAKNKSKYLIPIYMKIFLVQTEESELVYIAEINKNNSYIGELKENFNENKDDNICCILTDNFFKIKTFTSNCIDILKISSNIINSNYDVTTFIKQINDDVQTDLTLTNKDCTDYDINNATYDENLYMKINEIESNKKVNLNTLFNNSIETKLKCKKRIIKSKFLCPRKITWKIENNDKASILYPEKTTKTSIKLLHENSENINNKYEKKLMMLVKEAYISNKQVGYFFYFKNIYNFEKSVLKIAQKQRMKKNSIFKSINIEEILRNSNNPEEDTPKVRNYRGKFYHKKSENFSDNSKIRKKSLKYFDLENSNNSKFFGEENDINFDYIPHSNFNFILNLDLKLFIPSVHIQYPSQLIEKLKREANNKLIVLKETIKTKKSFSSSKSQTFTSSQMYSSKNYSSSQNMSDENSSNNHSENIIKEDILIKNFFGNKLMINKNINNYYENYYKVNIKNIRFIIYDFKRDKFIEIKEEKKSQVDFIKDNYKLNNKIYSNEDENYPSLNIHKTNNKTDKNNKDRSSIKK